MFVHRLALALGCTIKELSARMSLRELTEWMAFYELEPWGSSLDGIRIATNTAAVYNAGLMQAAPKRLRSNPCKPQQFYQGVNVGPVRRQGLKEQKAKLDVLATRGRKT